MNLESAKIPLKASTTYLQILESLWGTGMVMLKYPRSTLGLQAEVLLLRCSLAGRMCSTLLS